METAAATAKSQYVEIPQSAIPPGVRVDTPPENHGQIIEVSYGGFASHLHCHGDICYKRVHDRSVGPLAVTYYRLVRHSA